MSPPVKSVVGGAGAVPVLTGVGEPEADSDEVVDDGPRICHDWQRRRIRQLVGV